MHLAWNKKHSPSKYLSLKIEQFDNMPATLALNVRSGAKTYSLHQNFNLYTAAFLYLGFVGETSDPFLQDDIRANGLAEHWQMLAQNASYYGRKLNALLSRIENQTILDGHTPHPPRLAPAEGAAAITWNVDNWPAFTVVPILRFNSSSGWLIIDHIRNNSPSLVDGEDAVLKMYRTRIHNLA